MRPLVLIHGYSDRGESFGAWAKIFRESGRPDIRVVTYRSLVNEISVKDIAEGFEKLLRQQAGLEAEQPFDAVVHSTGMLVLRAWLARYAGRNLGRLKHLVALAPATFGSPLAHKGNSWLGAIFKGNRELGPDFLDCGKQILNALELGSRFTWDLAHEDLLGAKPFYGPTNATPWVFTFCGADAYGGLRRVANSPGTDGTVRLAGCPLNTMKVNLDLSAEHGVSPTWSPRPKVESPLWPVPGLNHDSILTAPSAQLQKLVLAALGVNSQASYEAWMSEAKQQTDATREKLPQWQQFVVRARDERGDPIPDYFLELSFPEANRRRRLLQFTAGVKFDVHAYGEDPSLRCFHLDTRQLEQYAGSDLHIRFTASSGSRYVAYRGIDALAESAEPVWQARASVPVVTGGTSFFYPFTTTLIELTLNREVNLSNEASEQVIFPVPV
jgi:pimeloyl-ACP methyl ester carboxylesterase